MTWIQLSADTTDEAIDWMRTLLAEIDFTGEIRIIAQPDSNHPASAPSAEWTLTVQLYLPDDPLARATLNQVSHQLSALQRTGMMSDWRRATVAELPPDATVAPSHTIGRFVIRPPSATEPVTADRIALQVSPGLAFGSGFHPATGLCLHMIERYVMPGMQTLDLGCGSGILSVAMAKLGSRVTALDNDPIAIAVTQATLDHNGVAPLVTACVGSLGQGSTLGHWMGGALNQDLMMLEPQQNFDLIVANIFARIHLSLISDYRAALNPQGDRGGLLITAGYDTDYEQEIDQALQQAGFQAIAREHCGNWVAFTHRLDGQ